jgi:hypothetical protein
MLSMLSSFHIQKENSKAVPLPQSAQKEHACKTPHVLDLGNPANSRSDGPKTCGEEKIPVPVRSEPLSSNP